MRTKTKNEDREVVKEKDWSTMTLVEIRDFIKRKSEALAQDELTDKNAEHVKKWLDLPITEFEDRWNKAKQDKGPVEAYNYFLIMAGALTVDGAIKLPDNYNGPSMYDVIEWRMRELKLVYYAKYKDDERLDAAAGSEKVAEDKKVDIPF